MRMALADVPKSFSRRDGRVYLTPRLLRPRDLRDELTALIALYEASLGRRRADFPEDRPAEVIGDFRLARSLTICLTDWYGWQGGVWPGAASEAEAAALAARGVTSPTTLRLALYDFAQTACGGYLPTAQREARLDDFAASLGIARATLDALLRLDDAREERLARVAACGARCGGAGGALQPAGGRGAAGERVAGGVARATRGGGRLRRRPRRGRQARLFPGAADGRQL